MYSHKQALRQGSLHSLHRLMDQKAFLVYVDSHVLAHAFDVLYVDQCYFLQTVICLNEKVFVCYDAFLCR